MSDAYTDFQTEAIKRVRQLWHMYLVNPEPEELAQIITMLPDHFLMIGTGRHELYRNREEFLAGMTADQIEARSIEFELQDEWYDVCAISDDICVVFGSIWVREKPVPGKAILVDMEGSRFTVVCRKGQNDIEICSIHHSMPYIDQGEDEFYPKTLSSLANEAIQKSKVLEHRLEMDHMTELYNRVYMEWHAAQAIKQEVGYFYILDLDNFKQINDTMGHLAGDKVILAFANLLRKMAHPSALLGRMGGDEFAVWDSSIHSKKEAERRFAEVTEGCRQLSTQLHVSISCSAGITSNNRAGEDFTTLYQRADQALYQAKSNGKGCYCWAE